MRLATLVWVFLSHLAGIYLFTRGFLLMRLALPDISSCEPPESCSLPPTHKRAVVLVIDALRFDFVSPNPPNPPSPYHHNIFTLPRQLASERPEHSFLFDSHADPPTTTLQRIKGLTTGSLPTFIDVGNNLGATSITEDSIMVQLQRAGKKAAFMGDDTWMSVFPDSFDPNMTHPYDSFNVEDLHTVDEAVIRHLFPLLEDPTKPFDFLIGHFLGVDHVGHRVGPDHPLMKAKLEQMNDVLTRVLEKLDEDTLLVLLGDHGMDRSGDHGGDGIHETSAALWIYSKGAPLTTSKTSVPSGLLEYRTFPGASAAHRSIQQIDLLPTLSLLLGLPIPFNNLGSVIPELFWRDSQGKTLEKALELNANQVQRFLTAYRGSSSGRELDEAWNGLQQAWKSASSFKAIEAKSIALNNFARQALAACRTMWAQFNPLLMTMGLVLFGVSLVACWGLYVGISKEGVNWQKWLRNVTTRYVFAGIGGGFSGVVVYFVCYSFVEGVGMIDYVVFLSTLASCGTVIFFSPPFSSFLSSVGSPTFTGILSFLIPILHAATFLSNSFTIWEDRIITFLVITSIVPYTVKGFTAPTSRLRTRILSFSLLFAVCVRLMALSTVCREEQQPSCHVTFYASSSLTAAPTSAVFLALPVALGLPWVVKRFLSISLSDNGIAKFYYPWVFAPSLIAGAGFWVLEWGDTTSALGEEWNATLRLTRTWLARFGLAYPVVVGGALWYAVPLCIRVETYIGEDGAKKANVIGFGNFYGSPYLVFWSISFVVLHVTSQIPAQIVLGFGGVALLAWLEVLDSVRDVESMERLFENGMPSALLNANALSSTSTQKTQPQTQLQQPQYRPVPFKFADIIPLALLGLHAFYATGHQATISSIQWKTAFLLTETVKYPWSAITAVTNSIGAIWVFAVAVPLLALWNKSPSSPFSPKDTSEQDDGNAISSSPSILLLAMSFMMFYTSLLVGTSLSAAILRRHLMVWKIFAPRFMLAAICVVVVDLAVLWGVAVGAGRGESGGKKFSRTFFGSGQESDRKTR